MAFWWFKLEFCQPSLLPSKKSIYKNFPYEVKVYQNLVLFAFCIFWARTGWSKKIWTEPRRPHQKVVRFHICGYTHCQFHFGCMTRNCKKKLRKHECWKNYCPLHESISAFSKHITSNLAASVFYCWNFAEHDVGRFWGWDLKNALIDSCNAEKSIFNPEVS